MIKVNLISVASATQAPARDWFPKEQRAALLGLALLISTAVGVSSWWFYLSHERHNVQAGITSAEAELVRLKEVAVAVEKAKTRKMDLADRLDLIERLRVTMRAPVSLLETVSQSSPHGLWLLEIKTAGPSVTLDGRAMSLTPVTDFAKALDDTGFFKNKFEITTTSEVVDETAVIRFTMKADVAAVTPTNAVKATASEPAPAPLASDSATPSYNPATSPMSPELMPVPAAGLRATPAPGTEAPSAVAPPKSQLATVRSSGGR